MELHELTDEEWECFERLNKIACESTLESRVRSLQRICAFVEENEDFFASLPEGLLDFKNRETG